MKSGQKKCMNPNSAYISPGTGGQGKASGRQTFYTSPGKGGQRAVGAKRQHFGTSSRDNSTVKG